MGPATPPSPESDFYHGLLSPYLRNPAILDDIQPEIGVQEAVNVERVLADAWFADRFTFCLGAYWRAYEQDPQLCTDEIARWDPAVDGALSHYWSLVQLQNVDGELDLEDFAAETFRSMGTLLEACLQPYLKELLAQVRIVRSKATENIDQLEFGNVISELMATTAVPDLFAPPPLGVPLNQWRNTPQHFKYSVAGDRVTAEFGKGPSARLVTFTDEALAEAFARMMGIYRVVRTARTLFFLDNLGALRNRIPPKPPRNDLAFFNFVTLAGTQGFDVLDVQVDGEEATVVLQDVVGGDRAGRMIHAGQFVVQLWLHTGKSLCTVESRDVDGVPGLRTVASGADCEKVVSGELSLADLAARVSVQPLGPEGR